MDDRTLLVILAVLILGWMGFMTYQGIQFARIVQEIDASHERMIQQHQNFLANQATILRDNDRMLHQHDATTQEHRALLQRLAH